MQPKSSLSSASRDPYFLSQQETPTAFPKHPGEVKPSTNKQEAPGQESEAPEEGEPTSTQEGTSSQLPQIPAAVSILHPQ